MKKNTVRKLKVHVILWCIAVFTLVIGCMNLHSSFVVKDYRCLDGEITDLKECEVLQKSGYVTRYNYSIVWYDNGVQYKKSVHEAIERPEETLTKVWVNANNMDVILGKPSDVKMSAYIDFGIAIITFVLGMLFRSRQNTKRRMSVDEMESMYYMAVVTAVLMVLSDLFMIFLCYRVTSRHIYMTPVFWDLAIVFTVVLLISVVISVKLKKKIK